MYDKLFEMPIFSRNIETLLAVNHIYMSLAGENLEGLEVSYIKNN